MTPGQLVKSVADVTGLTEETVTQHDRNLVKAGLRTKGGRGKSAAKVTYADAARLITASLGSLRVKDSVDMVLQHEATAVNIGRCQFSEGTAGFIIPSIPQPPTDHSFVDMIAAIIEGAASQESATKPYDFDNIRVTVSYPWTEPEVAFYDDNPDYGGPDYRGGKLVARLVYTPSVSRKLIPAGKAEHEAWWSVESALREQQDFSEEWFDAICIRQKRIIRGSSLMFLGKDFAGRPSRGETFREGGPRPPRPLRTST